MASFEFRFCPRSDFENLTWNYDNWQVNVLQLKFLIKFPTTFLVYTHEIMWEFHAMHDYNTPKEMERGLGKPIVFKH
jgi:hypothetical protein